MSDEITLGNIGSLDSPITDLIARAAGPLIEGDDFFRELVNALPAAVYTTDPSGRITYYNEAAAALWGCRPDLGNSDWCGSWKLFWPDGRAMPHDQCPMATAVKKQQAIRGLEAVAERPDGSRVPFLPFPTPIFNEAGVFVGAVNMLVDISERKRAEEATQRLASIVDSSDDAIISKDLDGIISSWNKGAERIFGYMAEEIIGKSIKVLIPREYHAEEDTILDRLRRGQRIEHYETIRQHKHGSLINVSLTVSPVADPQGKIVGASKIARDITERKRTEAQISLLAREAEHRTKNILATVQATVHLTQSETIDGLKSAIEGRIQALANVHALFVESRWEGAHLNNLVTQELSPYCQDVEARTRIEGPDLLLEPYAAQTIAITLHELATNAAKYGALSVPGGYLEITSSEADDKVLLTWRERGGPRIDHKIDHEGFGSILARMTVTGQFGGNIDRDWQPDGLRIRLSIDRARLVSGPRAP